MSDWLLKVWEVSPVWTYPWEVHLDESSLLDEVLVW